MLKKLFRQSSFKGSLAVITLSIGDSAISMREKTKTNITPPPLADIFVKYGFEENMSLLLPKISFTSILSL